MMLANMALVSTSSEANGISLLLGVNTETPFSVVLWEHVQQTICNFQEGSSMPGFASTDHTLQD